MCRSLSTAKIFFFETSKRFSSGAQTEKSCWDHLLILKIRSSFQRSQIFKISHMIIVPYVFLLAKSTELYKHYNQSQDIIYCDILLNCFDSYNLARFLIKSVSLVYWVTVLIIEVNNPALTLYNFLLPNRLKIISGIFASVGLYIPFP